LRSIKTLMKWTTKNNHIVQDLLNIRQLWYDAVIGGGAVRDAFHRKPYNDVDIFINFETGALNVDNRDQYPPLGTPLTNDDWLKHWGRLLRCKPTDNIRFLGSNYNFGDINNHILGVWNIIKSRTNYQIILISMGTHKYIQDFFDFGICKAYCDGEKMHFTEQFLKDYMQKTITLYPEYLSTAQIEYAKGHHLQKIKNKYPNYTPQIQLIDAVKGIN